MKKYSKQRELIIKNLRERKDHPTAEKLFEDLKNVMPKIGIATVYRNLSGLCDEGEIIKIKSKCASDRYDGNRLPHIHFECNKCGELYDIYLDKEEMNQIDIEMKEVLDNISANYEGVNICINGICSKCK